MDAKKLTGQKIGHGIDQTKENRLVQTRLRQDDDRSVCFRTSGDMRVPEADRYAVRGIKLTFLWVGQRAIGKHNMKGLAVRAGDHGHRLTQAAEKARFTMMHAVRTKIEIPMGNVFVNKGFVLHGPALQVQTKPWSCAEGLGRRKKHILKLLYPLLHTKSTA